MITKKLAPLVISFFITIQILAQNTINYDQILLNRVRQAATYIVGDLPKSINYIKFAESPRTWKVTIEGGSDSTYIQARTAFQIMYNKKFIMIDSGMDQEIHSFFGKGKKRTFL